MVVHRGTKWLVLSESGKKLGEYDTEEAARRRLRQIEMWKHIAESAKVVKDK